MHRVKVPVRMVVCYCTYETYYPRWAVGRAERKVGRYKFPDDIRKWIDENVTGTARLVKGGDGFHAAFSRIADAVKFKLTWVDELNA